MVDVAVPVKSVPFWIARPGLPGDGPGARERRHSLEGLSEDLRPGWIGLGVNGLDRTPVAHYVVFVRPSGRRTPSPPIEPIVTLDARQSPSWKTARGSPGRQRGPTMSHKPFADDCPLSWSAPSCSSPPMPSVIPRCWPRAASGRPTSSRARVPTRSPSRSVPTRPASWSGPGGLPPTSRRLPFESPGLPKDGDSKPIDRRRTRTTAEPFES